jgi:NADH-quinone oxidoreductase subunit M
VTPPIFSNVLTILLLIPLVCAVALLLGKGGRTLTKASAVAQVVVTFVLLLSYDTTKAGYQFVCATEPLVPKLDMRLSLGVDGLGLVMLVLTALVTLAAVWIAPLVENRGRLFDACVLLISAGATGAFAAKDLFFFYAFHELALIPTFLLIGLWGSGERQSAAWKITVYLGLGSIVLLAGIADLFLSIPAEHRTFDLQKLQELAASHVIPAQDQLRPWVLLTVGFGILISLFPFHSWAAPAYASAPTPAAMLHAGVLKKFGLYGIVRLVVPFLPEALKQPVWGSWTAHEVLLLALLGNILYVGLVTISQRKLDWVIGFSSVMHMGYVFLGIASANLIGLSGACLLMFAHGLSVAALFGIVGHMREQEGSLSFERLSGTMARTPFLGICFAMAAFASIGLPGFANFASETMVFFGSFQPGGSSLLRTTTVLALWGVVISAVYMLRAYRSAFLGTPLPSSAGWKDIEGGARWALCALIASLLVAGCFPSTLLAYIKPTLEAALR